MKGLLRCQEASEEMDMKGLLRRWVMNTKSPDGLADTYG